MTHGSLLTVALTSQKTYLKSSNHIFPSGMLGLLARTRFSTSTWLWSGSHDSGETNGIWHQKLFQIDVFSRDCECKFQQCHSHPFPGVERATLAMLAGGRDGVTVSRDSDTNQSWASVSSMYSVEDG